MSRLFEVISGMNGEHRPSKNGASTVVISSEQGGDLPAPNEVVAKPVEVLEDHAAPLQISPDSRLVAWSDPHSLGAEKFRALVTRLDHVRKQSKLRSFQVTSSVINEGKTLVAGNVAITLYVSGNTSL